MRIFVAEDDEGERHLYELSFRKLGITNYEFADDGLKTLQFLKGDGEYADRAKHPLPNWLLLDLKMPRATGLDVLSWLYNHPECRVIPTIMLSNSGIQKDVDEAYRLGVNAYFIKPLKISEMVDVLALINHFWTIAQRPSLNAVQHCV